VEVKTEAEFAHGTHNRTSESPRLPGASSNFYCHIYRAHNMSANDNSSPELSYPLFKFTSCLFITRLYIYFDHGHVCEDCKCIRCVVARWVRTPTCNCKLPSPRHGWILDARVRIKRMRCRHEPKSRPIFPPDFCICLYPEKKQSQLRLAEPKSSSSEYSQYDSDCSSTGHFNEYEGPSFGELRKL